MADRTRLWLLFGLVGICFLPKPALSAGIHLARDRRDRRPAVISLRTFLNSRLPGWQPWDYPGINGQGILTLPGYVEQGDCHILLNNQLLIGRQVNVDTIQLHPGDLVRIGDYQYRLPQQNQLQF